MDPLHTTHVTSLAETTDPRFGITTRILDVPCLVEFWHDDTGALRVDLSSVEGDHTVSLRPVADALLADTVNDALVAYGDPLEWPGFFAGAAA